MLGLDRMDARVALGCATDSSAGPTSDEVDSAPGSRDGSSPGYYVFLPPEMIPFPPSEVVAFLLAETLLLAGRRLLVPCP